MYKEIEKMNMKQRMKITITLAMVCLLLINPICPVYAAPHTLEYTLDNSFPERIEPDGDGTVYDVTFNFLSGLIWEPYAALEGHGIGAKQWPGDPGRENYVFLGWYDTPEGTGEPYTKDTPIYGNTELYAKWDYTGPGGYWPRAHRGVIHGVAEGDSLEVNQNISITAQGHNTHLMKPNDQRFRWIPIRWRVSDLSEGEFTKEAPFTATFSLEKQGDFMLHITYKEEIFDGISWQETDQVREVEERSVHVN